jgi:hypothetical protein
VGKALFANNATTTLAASINTTATTINLTSGGGAAFPSPPGGDYFYGSLFDALTGAVREVVKVTARSTDTLTVVRGASPNNYSSGDKFELHITAEGMGETARVDSSGNLNLTGTGTQTGGGTGSTFAVQALTCVGTATAATFNTTSSLRYKQEPVALSRAVKAKFAKLAPKEFKWIATGRKDWGFIAEEVHEIMPERVALDHEGKPLAIEYGPMLALLVAIIQDQERRIDHLEELLRK